MKNKKFTTILNSSIWSHKEFIYLYLGRLIGLLGNQIYLLALPWLVYNISNSGSQMAIVAGFEMLPYIIFSLVGGVLSDKLDKKKIMIYGNILAMIPLVLIFILFETKNIELWHIYISSIIVSSLVAITMPAYEAIIPLIVKEDELISANSLTELTLSLTTILGPAMAGGLISILGADTGVLLNGIAFLIAGIIFSQVKFKRVLQHNPSNNIKELLYFFNDGLSYSVKHPLIKWGIFMSTSNNLILGAYATMLIYYMRDDIGLNASLTGSVIAITGIASAITSAFIAPQLSKKFRKGITMIFSLGLFGIGVVLVGLSDNLLLLILGQGLYVGSVTLFQINWYSLRQSITPKDYLGRVSGACRGIAYFGASLGSFLGGFLLTKVSVSNLFIINGSLVILISLITMISKLRYTDKIEDFNIVDETTKIHKL